MGLFGGGSTKTKTTVAPNAKVESLLKNIVNKTEGMDDSYISQIYAGLNSTQIQALNNLANNGQLNEVSEILMGRTNTGLEQQSNAASQLQNLIDNQTTGSTITNNTANRQRSGALLSNVNAQGKNTGLTGSMYDDASVRRAANQTGARLDANNALTQGQNLNSQEIGNQASQRQLAQSIIGMGNKIGQTNQNLGQQGLDLNNTAISNQLNAGNILQQNDNNQNYYNWQNANGAAQNEWNQLNNRLNVANSINGMVGYTQTTKGNSGVSNMQQLAGAGIAGLGIAGNLGAFKSLGQSNNAWNSYNASGRQSGVAGPTQSGGNLSTGANQSPWYNFWS